MTSLIKSSEVKRKRMIRGLDNGLMNSVTPGQMIAEPVVDAQQSFIDSLKTEISKLEEKLQRSKAEHEQAIEKAKLLGKEEASAIFQKDHTESVERLKKGIGDAQKNFSDKLSSSDVLALAIAQTALKTIFDNASDYTAILTRMIEKQLVGLRRESILKFRVNSHDFDDPVSIENLATRLALDWDAIEIDPALKSGVAEIDLKLGHVEFSVPNLWDELKNTCDQLANGA